MSAEDQRERQAGANGQPASDAAAHPIVTDLDTQKEGVVDPDIGSVSRASGGNAQQANAAVNDVATPMVSEAAQAESDTASPDTDAESGESTIEGTYTDKQKSLFLQSVLFVLAALLCGQAVLVWFSTNIFKDNLEPRFYQAAEAVSAAMTERVRYATTELGIPINKLVGLQSFMSRLLDSADGVSYIVLQQPQNTEILAYIGLSDDMLERLKPNLPGTVKETGLKESGGFTNISFKIADQGGDFVLLHVGVDKSYLDELFYRILYDTAIVTLLSFLVAIKLLMFFIEVSVVEPLQRIRLIFRDCAKGLLANRFMLTLQDEVGELYAALNRTLNGLANRYEDLDFETKEASRAQIDNTIAGKIEAQRDAVKERYHFSDGNKVNSQNVTRIYLPLFLFIFSEEFLRSFIPLLINERNPFISEPVANLSISLPIAFYMIAVLFVLMLGDKLSKRFSCQALYMTGVIISIIGYVATFYTSGYYDLFLYRFLSGIGYGFVFLAAQIWIIENTINDSCRIKGTGVFILVLLVSSLCGPPIGGMVAFNIGFEQAFLVSAVLTLISGIIAYNRLDSRSDSENEERCRWTILDQKEWSIVLSSVRFMVFVLFCMLPVRLLLTGLLFLIMPLYLNQLGNTAIDIGRIMMVYSVAPIILSFFIIKIIGKYQISTLINGIGSVIPVIGCISLLFLSTAFVNQEISIAAPLLVIGLGYGLSLNVQPYIFEEIIRKTNEAVNQQSVINTYQLIEYIGFAMGAIIGGILATLLQYSTAMVVMGSVSLVCIIIYQIIMLLLKKKKRTDDYILAIKRAQQNPIV